MLTGMLPWQLGEPAMQPVQSKLPCCRPQWSGQDHGHQRALGHAPLVAECTSHAERERMAPAAGHNGAGKTTAISELSDMLPWQPAMQPILSKLPCCRRQGSGQGNWSSQTGSPGGQASRSPGRF